MQPEPSARFQGLPLYVDARVAAGAWAAVNGDQEILSIHHPDGSHTSFVTQGLVKGSPHATAIWASREAFDRIINFVRSRIKLVP